MTNHDDEPRSTLPPPTLRPSRPPTTPSDTLKAVRVTGTVTTSTPECLEVTDANGIAWSLTGTSERPAVGARVTVRGLPVAVPERGGPPTLCTGAPLRVDRLTVASDD